MPVSKGRKKKPQKKQNKARGSERGDFVALRHPFQGLPREVVQQRLLEIGTLHQGKFSEKLSEVEAILSSLSPLLVISLLSRYGLVGSIDDSGHISAGYKGDVFNQSHVEVVQALTLRIPSDRIVGTPPDPNQIQQLFDLLPDLGHSYSHKRLTQLDGQRTEEESAAALIQEELRIHTQAVRNWGLLGRVARITSDLCAPIDDLIQKEIGLAGTQLIKLFLHLVWRQERICNENIEKLKPVFRESTIHGMLRKYHEANPHLDDSISETFEFARKERISRDQMKSMLLAHSDLCRDEEFLFSADLLATELGWDAAGIASALDKLSMKFGELTESNSEDFFLSNPVWIKPLIKISESTYFCALPQAFFSFVFPIFSSLLVGNASIAKRYSERRSEFLENETRKLFERAFPDCQIFSGYKWQEDGTQYENDLMIRVDSHLILVEVKSHSISWPALRGAPERAKKHVKEILLEPSLQSLRLAAHVRGILEDQKGGVSLNPEFPMSLNQVRTILRLSVTLEDFATLQTTLHQAKNANWIPLDHPIAPCFLLSDLEIVFDVLELTSHKIHYLKRRADLEKSIEYKGDELDLLGFYLKTGFNIGQAESAENQFMLTGMSKPIDSYYMALEENVVTTKPVPKVTDWWMAICKRLEARDFHQWSDVADALLNVSLSDQKGLTKEFKRVVNNVHENWRIEGHTCAATLMPPKKKDDALAIYAFKDSAKDERLTRMENVASGIFEEEHVNRCLIIGINIDKMHYPYSSIAIYFRTN